MLSLRHMPALVFALTLPGIVAAQSGPGLILQPWDEPTFTQIDTNLHLFGSVDIDDTDDSLRLRRFQAHGRFRFDAEPSDDELRVGYNLIEWRLRSGDDALPRRLVDASVGAGWSRQLDIGRSIGVTAGIGYAGDRPFGESEALYGLGNLIFRQALDERSMLTFTLNYDGNRTIWPDIPLPLIAYSRRVNDELSYTLGVPVTSVRWTPHEQWILTASYIPALTFNARAEYVFHEAWRLFGSFENEYHGFADGDRDRRLFFRQRRAEGGIRYEPHHQWHVVLAGGYAFDQRFERGWDARDTTTVRDVDDAPYIRAAIGFEF